ncbi:hypothetical protein Ddc_09594 [Ditylenchus destructor]|nr:hypothetical protein Ddc_09594 [Ditylenchus destructor]
MSSLVAFRYTGGEATTHISGRDGWKEQAAAPGVAPHSIHPSLKSNRSRHAALVLVHTSTSPTCAVDPQLRYAQPKGAATGKSGRRESSDEIAETEKTDGCIGRREPVVDDLR